MNIDYLATALALLTFFGISALMALSLNLEYGVAGVPNFGKALFVSAGPIPRVSPTRVSCRCSPGGPSSSRAATR